MKRIIFYVSLLVLIISVLWLYYETEFEPLLMFLAAVLGLLSEFPLNKYENYKLNQLNRNDLISEAKRLSIETSSLNKRELRNAIDTANLKKVNKWNSEKYLAILIGVVIITPIIISFNPPKSEIPPNLSIAYYKLNDSKFELVRMDSIELDIDVSDIRNNRMKFPVSFAINNSDFEKIEVEKVEIIYPNYVKIKSTGTQKIDPTNSTIIYEHSIKTLNIEKSFTPISTLDTLYLETNFIRANTIVIYSDQVPVLMSSLVDDNFWNNREIIFTVKIWIKDRPTLERDFKFNLMGNVDVHTDIDAPRPIYTLSKSDTLLFKKQVNGLKKVLTNRLLMDSTTMFRYELIETKNDLYQYLYVNNILRRINIDYGKDRRIDKGIINNDHTIEPNFYFIPDGNNSLREYEKY